MTLQPYPEYKDSGLHWLDEVPESWAVEPLRNLSGFTTGWTPPTGNADSYDGDFLWANISDLGSKFLGSTAKRLSAEAVASNRIPVSPRGSLLFSFKLTIGSVSIADTDMYTNEAIATFRPSNRLLIQYAYFSLPFFVVRNATENIYGAPMLNARLMRSARVAVPPVDEQRQIADYLDAQTAKIDALIGKQEQLIETLAERRQAVISHAVTKGLDPNAPMKDSGVEWLGRVPATWTVKQVKKAFQVTLGKMLDAGRDAKYGDEMLPYVRAANIQPQGLDLSDVRKMPFTAAERSWLSLKKSDLLVVEGGAVGVCVVLNEDMPGWSFQKTVNRVRATGGDSAAFLGFFLDTIRQDGVIDMLCNKSTIAHFTAEKLNAVEVAFPPTGEQREIVEHLNQEASKLGALSAKAREMIDILKERRQALISAAVTGKIDVRGLT